MRYRLSGHETPVIRPAEKFESLGQALEWYIESWAYSAAGAPFAAGPGMSTNATMVVTIALSVALAIAFILIHMATR